MQCKDYQASFVRSKIDILKDLLKHIECDDIDDDGLKEYYKELQASFKRRSK